MPHIFNPSINYSFKLGICFLIITPSSHLKNSNESPSLRFNNFLTSTGIATLLNLSTFLTTPKLFIQNSSFFDIIFMANTKQTSKSVASKASKILKDGRYSATSKSVAGSALAQTKKSK